MSPQLRQLVSVQAYLPTGGMGRQTGFHVLSERGCSLCFVSKKPRDLSSPGIEEEAHLLTLKGIAQESSQ